MIYFFHLHHYQLRDSKVYVLPSSKLGFLDSKLTHLSIVITTLSTKFLHDFIVFLFGFFLMRKCLKFLVNKWLLPHFSYVRHQENSKSRASDFLYTIRFVLSILLNLFSYSWMIPWVCLMTICSRVITFDFRHTLRKGRSYHWLIHQ